MKHYSADLYLELLRSWDKKHHLLGRTNADLLYRESVSALKSLPAELIQDAIVDLGAGNGILGVPALLEGLSKRVCLIEPLPKRVAFLEALRAEMRMLGDPKYEMLSIVPLPVQNVSRETFERVLGSNMTKVPVLSRAFSGTLTMPEALAKSHLKENPSYKFFVRNEAHGPQYVLVKEP